MIRMKAVDFRTFKTVHRMSLNRFNRWIESIYKAGVQDGVKEGEKEFDECYTFTVEDLSNLLQTVPGIGRKTVGKIIDTILNSEEDDGSG